MKRIVVALAAVILLLILTRIPLQGNSSTGAASAQAAANPPRMSLSSPEIHKAVAYGVSAPLRSIPPAPAPASPRKDYEPENPIKPRYISAPFAHIDPVVQRSFGPLAMPTPIFTFKGFTQQDNASDGPLIIHPPDTEGDVGAGYYFQWNNIGFKIFDTSGKLLLGPRNGNTLFTGMTGNPAAVAACTGTNSGDPIVLFDPISQRWLASQFTTPNAPVGPTYECIAISTSSDPTGAYYRYAFQSSPTAHPTWFEDYPHLGVWPDAYYMTTNEFNADPNSAGNFAFMGAGVFAFDRDKMLVGDSTATMQYFHQDPPYGGMLPADMDGTTPPPPGSPNYILEADDSSTAGQDKLSLFKFHVDWTIPASSTLSGPVEIPVADFDSDLCPASRQACIPQPDPQKLEVVSDKLMHRLAYRNFGDHESLVVNQTVDADGSGKAGVRWYELRAPNAVTPTLYQQGTYAPDSSSRWMGSIAMDHDGNIGLGFSVSNSSNLYPSIHYTGRLAGDTLGQMTLGEGTLYPGLGSQYVSGSDLARWGDYSAMSVDPTDDCTFYYTQEYYPTTGEYWATRIGKFRFPSCGGGNIPTETPQPTPNPCALPGVTVLTDPTGDVGAGGVGTGDVQKYDVQSISIGEPYSVTLTNHLVFTMKVASLSGPDDPTTSPDTSWNIYFTLPGATAVSYVSMQTNGSGTVSYKYSYNGGTAAAADAGTYRPDGTITIVLDRNKLLLNVGDTLGAIYSRVIVGALVPENVNYPEPDKSVNYTLVGNAYCQNVPNATATPTDTGTATSTGTSIVNLTGTPTATGTVVASTNTSTATRTATTGAASATSTTGAGSTNTATRTAVANTGTATRTATPNATATACAIKFADVPPVGEGSTFYGFVRCLACRHIVSGYPCGGPGEPCNSTHDPYYRPNANVTRGQLSKIVALSAGLSYVVLTGRQSFHDVVAGDPFYTYIEQLAQTGAITGYPCNSTDPQNGEYLPCDAQNHPWFRPNNLATRGQISKIVSIAAGFVENEPADRQTFTDVPHNSPFWVYIERLAARNIINGYNTADKCPSGVPCFRYNDNTTRGQMAKIDANSFFPNCQTPARP